MVAGLEKPRDDYVELILHVRLNPIETRRMRTDDRVVCSTSCTSHIFRSTLAVTDAADRSTLWLVGVSYMENLSQIGSSPLLSPLPS